MLTDQAIRGLKPTDKLRYVKDGKVDGLYVAVAPSGTKSFRWQRAVGGRSQVKTLGRFSDSYGLADARDAANAINAGLRKGEAPAQPRAVAKARAGRMTVNEAYDLYHAAKGAQKRTADRKRQMYDNHIAPAIGTMALSDVTKASLKAIVRAKAETAPLMANRVLAEIKTFMKWCVQEDDITGLELDPSSSIAKPSEERERQRKLTQDEIAYFLAGIEGAGRLRAPWMLLLLTGCRLNEVLEAKWSEVAEDRWLIGLDRAKNECEHLVPFTPEIKAIFDGQRAFLAQERADREVKGLPVRETDLVFPGKRASVMGNLDREKKALDARMAKLAGHEIPHWRNHDLRRTMSSAFGEILDPSTGMPIVGHDMIDELLNHKDGEARKGTRKHYNINAYAEPKRKALTLYHEWLKPMRERAAEMASGPK